MEEALLAYLLAHAGTTALVATRIYWMHRPQGSLLPAVVLHRIGRLPNYHMGGDSELYQTRVQVDSWGSTPPSAHAVARQVFTRLNTASFTQSGVTFFETFADIGSDDYEQGPGGADLYKVTQDFILWHSA